MIVRHRPLALAIALALAGPATAQEIVELSQLNGDNGFVANGIGAFGESGAAVSSAGDINGDGIDDVLIGARQASPNGDSTAGEAYVVFGTKLGFPAALELDALDGTTGFRLKGIASGDYAGQSVSAAGDINGDGIDDLVIGASRADAYGDFNAGETYLVFGTDQGFAAEIELDALDGSNGLVLRGINSPDLAGFSVSGAGDINGDGVDDLLIGARNAAPDGRTSAGVSYVVFGSETGLPASIDLSLLDGSNGFALNGVASLDESGTAVSNAGDFNGDGFDDLLIGAHRANPNDIDNAGESYLVFGTDQGFDPTIELSALDGSNGFVLRGISSFDRSGYSLSSAGDVNGDGFGDLIIGAYRARPEGRIYAGESYVVFGTNTGLGSSLELATLDGSNGFVLRGIAAQDQAGFSVSGAGDVNGDGYDDVVIGALTADPDGAISAGESNVVFGSDQVFPAAMELSSLRGANGFVLHGVLAGDLAGSSVGGEADINGDGIDDMIIGARGVDRNGDSAVGATYVVFGNAAPLAMGDTTSLISQLEDDTGAAGSRLDFTVAAHYLDTDPFAGVAVVGDASSAEQGQWQYSDDGISWMAFPGGLSDASALVLDATTRLRFLPAADFFGQPGELAVRLWDARWRMPGEAVDIVDAIGALGGFSRDEDRLDVTLQIMPVNDAPSFAATSPPAVDEDSGGVTIPGWSAFDPGAPNESSQFAAGYQVSNISNPALFAILPVVDFQGKLVYQPAPDASGSSSFDVRVVDSGGSDNGGSNLSDVQSFAITVHAVNDAPGFVATDPPAVTVGSGEQLVANWASFDPGAPDETGQTASFAVTALGNAALFEISPVIDAQGNLSYTPAADAVGESSFTVVVGDDGGTANGGVDTSAPQIFTIRVNGDALFADGFEGS